jgi:hypothetical protein
MTAHTMGPFVGSDSLGFHSDCSCGHPVEGATRDELRRAHQKHAGADALRPGVAKARQALAASLERGKPQPSEVAS